MNNLPTILILGGGEYASAIAFYLSRSRLPVVMAIHESEFHLRRPICFAEAVIDGKKKIEQVLAISLNEKRLGNLNGISYKENWKKAVHFEIDNKNIPIFLNTELSNFIEVLEPSIIVKGIGRYFSEVQIDDANLVIGLYPFHQIEEECHVAIETRQNFWLGSVYTSKPLTTPDFDHQLFKQPFQEVQTPIEGVFITQKEIGQIINHNEAFGKIDGVEIRSPYNGQIWGLFHSGRIIHAKEPLALIYEGKKSDAFKHFSYQHKTVAGTVLRECLNFLNLPSMY